MTLVNETSPCTSAASVLALSLDVRAAALADGIDALHRDLDARRRIEGAQVELREESA
jgi:hypothetical protein